MPKNSMDSTQDMYRQFLSAIHTLDDHIFHALFQSLQTRLYKKGADIILPGSIQKELYFVQSGTQMSYYEDEKKLLVLAFTYPPSLCAIPESFPTQQPSPCCLTCVTDSTLLALSFDELQILFDRYPSIERLFRKATEKILIGILQRHRELHTLTMDQRFSAFCSRSPHLLTMVPHKYIASYLGIDATNFSKLLRTVRF